MYRLHLQLHGATSQKTAFFIVTAVKTSNLTYCKFVWETYYQVDGKFFQQKHGTAMGSSLSSIVSGIIHGVF
jgi:hypothetical protein